jgi:hypothetical protein
MHRRTPLRAAIAAAALTTLFAAAAVAVAAIPDSSGTINACYGSNGKVRVVDAAGDCGHETHIALGGPTFGYAYSNSDFATIDEATTTVASLTLPAGKYLVHGKLDLLGGSSTEESFVVCNLTIDGTAGFSDAAWTTLEPGVVGRLSTESVALQTPVSFPADGTMLMTCIRPEGGPGAIARYRKLDAVRVDGLTTS